jgi:hypothetical protein
MFFLLNCSQQADCIAGTVFIKLVPEKVEFRQYYNEIRLLILL